MTPHDLIARFDDLAEAPAAANRLRALVIDLAVRGVLLDSSRPLHNDGSGPFDIPVGWSWATLRALGVEFQNGIAKRRGDAGRPVPVLRLADVDATVAHLRERREIVLTSEEEAKYSIRDGDFLITRVNGSADIVGSFVDCSGVIDAAYCDHFIRARPADAAVTPFLLLVGKAPHVRRHIGEVSVTTAGQRTVNQGGIGAIQVPLPPLAEQKRIVARVDELMKLIDQLDAARSRREQARVAFRDSALSALQTATTTEEVELAWARVRERFDEVSQAPDGAKRLRATVLGLAATGRLVPQNPDEGDARPLLEALAKRRTSTSGRGRRIDSASLSVPRPAWLPKNWAWVPFGETHINRDGERVPIASEERELRRGNYDYYGASGVIDKIDDYLFEGSLLLIGEDGANLVLRSTPIAYMANGRYWVNNHAHVLDSVDESSLRFLAIFINSIDLKPYLTGTAQPKLNQAKMNNIPCGFPPLAEQKRIVAHVDELMGLIDQLETALQRERESLRAFASAAVHHLDA